MLELQTLSDDALRRIEAAGTPEALEEVRVEVLGRKGTLAEISKGMGKLPPAERERNRQAAEPPQAGTRERT